MLNDTSQYLHDKFTIDENDFKFSKTISYVSSWTLVE